MSLERLRTSNRYSPPPSTKKLYNKANFRRTKFEKAEFTKRK